MKAFEIHTLQNGRWKIDSVFDDLELAVFEAKQMHAGGKYPGVRVVEEEFDEASRRTAARTVYHSSGRNEPARPAERGAAPLRAEPAARPTPLVAPGAGPARADPYGLISILAAAVVFGLAVLFGFRVL